MIAAVVVREVEILLDVCTIGFGVASSIHQQGSSDDDISVGRDLS